MEHPLVCFSAEGHDGDAPGLVGWHCSWKGVAASIRAHQAVLEEDHDAAKVLVAMPAVLSHLNPPFPRQKRQKRQKRFRKWIQGRYQSFSHTGNQTQLSKIRQ